MLHRARTPFSGEVARHVTRRDLPSCRRDRRLRCGNLCGACRSAAGTPDVDADPLVGVVAGEHGDDEPFLAVAPTAAPGRAGNPSPFILNSARRAVRLQGRFLTDSVRDGGCAGSFGGGIRPRRAGPIIALSLFDPDCARLGDQSRIQIVHPRRQRSALG